jgi:prevent-host-death family protein
MKQVNLYEAKTNLSALVEEAKGGEEIIIAKNGKPAARLVALGPAVEPPQPRRFGFWAKYGYQAPDDLVERLQTDEELLSLFEEGPVFPTEEPEQ